MHTHKHKPTNLLRTSAHTHARRQAKAGSEIKEKIPIDAEGY